MVDTLFYIDNARRIRSKNGDSNDNLFYMEGKFVYGPKNSAHFWLEGNQFLSDAGDSGFRLMPNNEIFGPSQYLPWLA
jgi:hypothetical protein